MLNISIFSLSITSLYSISPLFSGNKVNIQNSSFHYLFSPIFLNLNHLSLEKSAFAYGINSIINIEKEIIQGDQKIEKHDDDHTEYYTIDYNGNLLYIIRDCKFRNYKVNSSPLIRLTGEITVYITSCVFDSCIADQSLLKLEGRACTISHICCSNIKSENTNDNIAQILDSNTKVGSFFKFIYSTIAGEDDIMLKYVIKFDGTCSIRCQCINITKQSLSYNENYAIIYITSPSCLEMVMNTFHTVNADKIIHAVVQSNRNDYAQYINKCNFYNIDFVRGCIFLDMFSGKKVAIEDCVFKLMEGKNNLKYIVKINSYATLSILNCIFDKEIDCNSIDGAYFSYTVDPNPQTNNLAHYYVEGHCDGTYNENAIDCRKNDCPVNSGCPPDAFSFTIGDHPYTEKFHSDIDTPTPIPTAYFSESSKFTFSDAFSKTNFFSESNSFSCSFYTNDSEEIIQPNDFTKSVPFSESNDFTKSVPFSESNEFSKSVPFSESNKFSKSNHFSKSNFFSASIKFTQSFDFTVNLIDKGDNSSNQGKEDDKIGKGALIGIIVGVIAAVAIIIALIVFFILKKKKNIDLESDANVLEGRETVISVDNTLQDIMRNDDPFAEEFK